ncbi:MAG: 4-(cytidine 5'-diphospho)-2-C-methyl-D-erythritol kinase, partial [Pedobacter sp.]
KDSLYDHGAVFALMSGSGSSVFGIFEGKVELKELENEYEVFYDC